MPHDLYVLITQSLAALMPGLPVRRGPIESNSVCDELLDVRAVHAESPDALQRRVVGGKVRRLLCAGDAGERNARDGDAREESAESHGCAGSEGD